MKSRFGEYRDSFADDRGDEDIFENRRRKSEPERGGGAVRWAVVWLVLCIGAALTAPAWVNRIKSVAPTAPATHVAALAMTAQHPKPQAVANRSVFTSTREGHFLIDADVNGAPVHFLVDTGATYVVLSDNDAEQAGINRMGLTFDHRFRTANGEVKGAVVNLRSLRIGQMEENEVAAVVMETPEPISLLGMSFLKRLDHYEIHDGQLTFFW